MFFIIFLWLLSLQSTFKDPQQKASSLANTSVEPATLPSLEQLVQKDPTGLGRTTEAPQNTATAVPTQK